MREAANFINAIAEGKTLSELGRAIAKEIATRRQEIDVLARALVESGMRFGRIRAKPPSA